MTETHAPAPAVPEWTLGWRLRRALDYAGMSQQAMADELGVARTTVNAWTNDAGKRPPRRPDLDHWARVTGVPADWLRTGDMQGHSDGGVSKTAFSPLRRRVSDLVGVLV